MFCLLSEYVYLIIKIKPPHFNFILLTLCQIGAILILMSTKRIDMKQIVAPTYRVELIDTEGNELTMTSVPKVDDAWKALMADGGWEVLFVEEEKIILV
jgi:hypothetical protein